MRRRFVLVAALAVLLVGPSLAQQVVIPNANANQAGPSNNAFPWNQGDMRYQQVYAADQFGGVSGLILNFKYRVDEQWGYAFTSNPITSEIRFSTTQAGPNNLSDVFAQNIGPDETLVWSGPITLQSAGNWQVFDINVDVNDVYSYNPAAGNLLIDIKVFGSAVTCQFDSAGTGLGQGGTPWTDRVWAIGVNSTTGSQAGDDGMVTQFTFIPEPASALALLALALLRRR
jgi:opacity protein-like surface antigen